MVLKGHIFGGVWKRHENTKTELNFFRQIRTDSKGVKPRNISNVHCGRTPVQSKIETPEQRPHGKWSLIQDSIACNRKKVWVSWSIP